jgi:pilus assembly protein CpaF
MKFRESNKKSTQPNKPKHSIMTKHQKLKNLLHKQIIQEINDKPIEKIVPKIDAMAQLTLYYSILRLPK